MKKTRLKLSKILNQIANQNKNVSLISTNDIDIDLIPERTVTRSNSASSNNSGERKISVYYQPPDNMVITYPAIIYQLVSLNPKYADNKSYDIRDRYQITYITNDTDDDVMYNIMGIEGASFERSFISDNLYHFVIVLSL